MSWPLASFALVGLALVAGFAWYERAHPTARVVALVATMAALAAAGRVAFAPLPNVKPTTDIVLLSGFALGGAPGFAVGALAGLASNFFFGQGPWTPWQMAAWGGAGIAGAGVARLTGGRAGRLTLALTCAAAGFAYGVVLNFSTFVTFSGRHTLGEYLAIAGAALPFDVAHAAGNFVFALAFGPALVRSLQRFRERFEVTWRPAPATASLVLAALLGTSALAAAPGTAHATTPAQYLRAAQNLDGGFGPGPRLRSASLYTGWAALGLAAAGQNPLDVRRPGGRTPVDHMRANLRFLNDTGELERTILVLSAAGVSPRTFGGRNLVLELDRRRLRSGAIGGQVVLTSFGILALRSTGRPTTFFSIRAPVTWLAGQQNPDGGFNFAGRGGPSGIDETGAALQALVAGGRRYTVTTTRAVNFLVRNQNPDGGFPLAPRGPSNAQSTAFAVQGLVAAGRNPYTLHRLGARSPVSYLTTLTTAGGLVRYSRFSAQTPVWVTAQALTALARRPFPLRRVARAPVRRLATAAAAAAGDADGEAARARAAGQERAGAGEPDAPDTPRERERAMAHDAGLLTGLVLLPVT